MCMTFKMLGISTEVLCDPAVTARLSDTKVTTFGLPHTHSFSNQYTAIQIFCFFFVLGSWRGESPGGLLQDAPTRTR